MDGMVDQRAAEPATFDWEDAGSVSAGTAPVLTVEGFEGPLDWLLEMARARKIDLARLSIEALIAAFAAALEAALARRDGGPTAELGRWGDWLVMAATLALLRSRLLLPADVPEAREAQSEAEALRRSLVSRAQVRAAADWLERRPQLGREVFVRGCPEASASGHIGDVTELLRACLIALQLPEPVEAYRPRLPSLWRVPDAIARITWLLGELPDGSALAAFLPKIDAEAPRRELRCRAAVASTLIAALELEREGGLALEQDDAWQPIQIRPNVLEIAS